MVSLYPKPHWQAIINIPSQIMSSTFLRVYIDKHLTCKECILALISWELWIILVSRIHNVQPITLCSVTFIIHVCCTLVYPYLSYCNYILADNHRSHLKFLRNPAEVCCLYNMRRPYSIKSPMCFNNLCILTVVCIKNLHIWI